MKSATTSSDDKKRQGLHRVGFTLCCTRAHNMARSATSRLEIVVGQVGECAVCDMGWCHYRWFLWRQRKNSKVKIVRAAADTVCRVYIMLSEYPSICRNFRDLPRTQPIECSEYRDNLRTELVFFRIDVLKPSISATYSGPRVFSSVSNFSDNSSTILLSFFW